MCVCVFFSFEAYTNYEDSESEHPSSNMDDEDDVSSVNGPATMGYLSGGKASV